MRTGPVASRRRVLTAFAAFGAFWGSWGAVLPGVQATSGADDAALGLALLMIGLGALASMRITGSLVDRFGGPVLPLTVAAFGCAAVLPSLARSPVTLGAALLVVGACSGAVDVAENAAGSAEEARSGPLLNLAHAAFSAAVLVSSLATAGARALGLGPVPILCGVAVLLVAVAPALRGAPAPPPTRPRDRPARGGRAAVLVVLGSLGALAYLVENAWQSWSAVHLASTLGASAGVAGLGPAVFAAATTTGRLLGQRLTDRLTDRQLLAGGAVVAAAGTVLAALARSLPLTFAGLAVAGIGTAVCAPTILGVTGRWAGPQRRAGAISTVTTLAYSGFLLGPAAVGLLAAAADLRGALLAVGGAALLLAVLSRAVPVVPRAGVTEERVRRPDR